MPAVSMTVNGKAVTGDVEARTFWCSSCAKISD